MEEVGQQKGEWRKKMGCRYAVTYINFTCLNYLTSVNPNLLIIYFV